LLLLIWEIFNSVLGYVWELSFGRKGLGGGKLLFESFKKLRKGFGGFGGFILSNFRVHTQIGVF
jgi:hypothetical protein